MAACCFSEKSINEFKNFFSRWFVKVDAYLHLLLQLGRVDLLHHKLHSLLRIFCSEFTIANSIESFEKFKPELSDSIIRIVDLNRRANFYERFVDYNRFVQHILLLNYTRDKLFDMFICRFFYINIPSYCLEFSHEYKVVNELMINTGFVWKYLERGYFGLLGLDFQLVPLTFLQIFCSFCRIDQSKDKSGNWGDEVNGCVPDVFCMSLLLTFDKSKLISSFLVSDHFWDVIWLIVTRS